MKERVTCVCVWMCVNSAVQEDVLYRQRDGAKKRAVLQGGSYEDFQNLVSVAHLRPINDKEPSRRSTVHVCTDIIPHFEAGLHVLT